MLGDLFVHRREIQLRIRQSIQGNPHGISIHITGTCAFHPNGLLFAQFPAEVGDRKVRYAQKGTFEEQLMTRKTRMGKAVAPNSRKVQEVGLWEAEVVEELVGQQEHRRKVQQVPQSMASKTPGNQ